MSKANGKVEALPGVGATSAEKLKTAGFGELLSIAVASPQELVNACGMTDTTARKTIAAARQSMDLGFESGEELLERRKAVIKLTTGSKAFDEILAGGVETGCITEAFGAYGSCKSQLAHQLAVNVQLPQDKGGANGYAVFLDTESTFRPERIIQMAEQLGLDPNKVLKNIKVARCFNSDHQVFLAEKVEELIVKEKLPIKLIIVDSLTAHYRSEYVGRGQLADRQQKLNKHMHTLMKIASAYNIAVYVTNQVMSKPDMFFGDPTEAIGGNVVFHNSNFRVYLRRGKKGTRVAKLVDSPHLPEAEAVFKVTEIGVEDVE
ncbi:DNA repair and recombination protein RadA [archaeon]|nr:DNA repair and recombination protein RadA [archaeon]